MEDSCDHRRCRGQCSIELVMVLIILTSAVLLIEQLSSASRKIFDHAVLSKESKK